MASACEGAPSTISSVMPVRRHDLAAHEDGSGVHKGGSKVVGDLGRLRSTTAPISDNHVPLGVQAGGL